MCPPPIRGTEVGPHVPPRSASLLPSVLLQGAMVSLEIPSWPFPFLLGFQDAEGGMRTSGPREETSLGRGPGAVQPRGPSSLQTPERGRASPGAESELRTRLAFPLPASCPPVGHQAPDTPEWTSPTQGPLHAKQVFNPKTTSVKHLVLQSPNCLPNPEASFLYFPKFRCDLNFFFFCLLYPMCS